jgi:hypothetical protein
LMKELSTRTAKSVSFCIHKVPNSKLGWRVSETAFRKLSKLFKYVD